MSRTRTGRACAMDRFRRPRLHGTHRHAGGRPPSGLRNACVGTSPPHHVLRHHRGGAYEISFLPDDDPAARANSTEGSRVLALEPYEHLAFEWRVPPWARGPARSAPPTRVDVRVETATDPAAPGATVLHLRHSGFGEGPEWDEVRSFFQRSWWEILTRSRRLDEPSG